MGCRSEVFLGSLLAASLHETLAKVSPLRTTLYHRGPTFLGERRRVREVCQRGEGPQAMAEAARSVCLAAEVVCIPAEEPLAKLHLSCLCCRTARGAVLVTVSDARRTRTALACAAAGVEEAHDAAASGRCGACSRPVRAFRSGADSPSEQRAP